MFAQMIYIDVTTSGSDFKGLYHFADFIYKHFFSEGIAKLVNILNF